MRTLLNRHSSTKAERKFHEILKQFHIPFEAKVKIMGREIDFIIQNYAIDIDGHRQDVSKNWMLRSLGYTPIHFNNNEIPNPHLIEWLKNINYGRSQISRDGIGGRSSPNHTQSLGKGG